MTRTQASVAIARTDGRYADRPPYDPDTRYPEYHGPIAAGDNPAYRAVRESLRLLGYDASRFGTAEWNPLAGIVEPGDRVFIKPNLVSHEYGRKNSDRTGDVYSVITHPSVVRAVADYVAIALNGQGEIIIGDNPSIDADFDKLTALTRLDLLPELYRERYGLECRLLDLREQRCDEIRHYGFRSRMRRLCGDPRGEAIVNLGRESHFHGLNPLLFRGVFSSRWETIRHHCGGRHEYSISNSINSADVFISIPKLKSHHKVGATLNIKGLVGICCNKNYLIHWRIGFPSWGGDEYPEPARIGDHLRLAVRHLAGALTPELVQSRIAGGLRGTWIDRCFQVRPYRGAWQGNDSCWRMAADLYLALQTRPKRVFSVIDGIVAGDGDGPFCPNARRLGVIIAGDDLLATDCAAVRLMDFRRAAIRYLPPLLDRYGLRLNRVRVIAPHIQLDNFFCEDVARHFRFAPPTNWTNLTLRTHSDEDHHPRRRKGRAAAPLDQEHAEAVA